MRRGDSPKATRKVTQNACVLVLSKGPPDHAAGLKYRVQYRTPSPFFVSVPAATVSRSTLFVDGASIGDVLNVFHDNSETMGAGPLHIMPFGGGSDNTLDLPPGEMVSLIFDGKLFRLMYNPAMVHSAPRAVESPAAVSAPVPIRPAPLRRLSGPPTPVPPTLLCPILEDKDEGEDEGDGDEHGDGDGHSNDSESDE